MKFISTISLVKIANEYNTYTCMLGLREPSVLMLTVSFFYPRRIFEQPRPQQSLRFTLNLLAPSIS